MMKMGNSHALGVAGVIAASCFWGTTGVSASLAPEVGPLAIGAAAMGGGGLLQAAIAMPLIVRSITALRSKLSFLILAGLSVALYPLAFYGSMRLAGITVGTVVSIGSAPALAALIEWLADGKRPTARFAFSALMGALGIAVLALARTGGSVGSDPALGLLAALLAGLTYAFYSWAAGRLMRQGIPGKAAMGSLFGIGAAFLFPVLLATGAPFLDSFRNLSVGLYMSTVPMFLGYLCFGFGLARIAASEATAISLLEPVVAAGLAALIAGERLPGLAWCGIGLIFASLAFLVSASMAKQ